MSDGFDERAVPRRTLAGATILQIVPSLRRACRPQRGQYRACAAARRRPRADRGGRRAAGERIDHRRRRADPDGQCQHQSIRLRRNARELEHLIGHERIDIIHAYDAGAAWSARIATSQVACWLVTSLPDVPTYAGMRGRYAGALAQGDRVIAPSNYSAVPIVERFGLRTEQITIVPRVSTPRPMIPPRCRPNARTRSANAGASRPKTAS